MIPTDEIISMAREAGIKVYAIVDTHLSDIDSLSAFAALVSARAAKDEREACAKVCDVEAEYWRDLIALGCAEASDICAPEIRSRKP